MISVEKIIQDIWILNDAGAVLFHRVLEKKVDEQLMGALMSALNLIAEELESGGLSSFEIKDNKYIIMRQFGISFIVNAPKKIKETNPDYLLILPWNLKDEIIKQMWDIRKWGGQFVVPIPEVTVYP